MNVIYDTTLYFSDIFHILLFSLVWFWVIYLKLNF